MIKQHTVTIWIAGDYNDAVRAIREFCEEGACFAVERCAYIYTSGMEDGERITRINYPRFPADLKEIDAQCLRLAEHLRKRLFQDSYTIESPSGMSWFSRRKEG